MRIELSPAQHLAAAAVGYRRQANAIRHGLKARHRHGSRWAGDIEGACAELAAAIAVGLPWTGEEVWIGHRPTATREPDIGRLTDVRWSAPTWNGAEPVLRIDTRDEPAWAYLLVVGYAPTFDVVGWMTGEAAPLHGTLRHYPERDVVEVPAGELIPPAKLPAYEELI